MLIFNQNAGGLATTLFSGSVFAASDPKAPGDIVARDLYFWGIGWLGHVGIWTGSKVLEVLNDDTVIHKTSLSTFKNSSPYWGARYGKGNNPYKVISWGYNQRNYNPSYTATTWYQIGRWVKKWVWNDGEQKWEQKWVKENAKYRCDTFVAVSFEKGDGTSLVNSTITPRQVYYSMPSQR